MSIKIIEVENRAALKRWVRVPFTLYRGDRYYVPQLFREELSYFDRRRNPSFEVCDVRQFLALEKRRSVGRICGLINSLETEKLGYKRGRFAWFESIDDQGVASQLLDNVREWLVEAGCEEMTGPHGFTDLDTEGLLIEGFEHQPTISGSYNPPYYRKLLETYGLSKDVDYVEFRFVVPDRVPLLERMQKRYANSGEYRVVPCKNRPALLAQIDDMWAILEAAFEPLYGVVPLTRKQRDYFTDKYFRMLDPEFVKFLYTRDDEMVAFLISVPNLSQAFRKAQGRLLPFGFLHVLRAMRRPDTVDFLLAGAKSGHPTNILTAIGLADMFQTLRRRGIRHTETNRELEDNTAVNQLWSRFETVCARRSRIFRMPLLKNHRHGPG